MMVHAYLSLLYSKKEITIGDVLELERVRVLQEMIDKYQF